MNSINTALGLPPLQTPITTDGEAFGIRYEDRQAGLTRGILTTAWAQAFNKLWARVTNNVYQISRTQTDLATLTAVLGKGDSGLTVNVTDYAHILQWDGSAWQWGPGESGSGYLAAFAVDPTGSGWHLCDGSLVTYLKADGTTGTVTLPNTAVTPAYLNLGPAYSDTITGATSPASGSGSADTGGGGGSGTFLTGPITLPGDPIPNFPAPLWFRQ